MHFLTNKILMQPRNSFGVYACFQEPGFFEAMNMNMGMTADTSMSPVSDQSLMTFLEQEAHQLIDCQAGRICIYNWGVLLSVILSLGFGKMLSM